MKTLLSLLLTLSIVCVINQNAMCQRNASVRVQICFDGDYSKYQKSFGIIGLNGSLSKSQNVDFISDDTYQKTNEFVIEFNENSRSEINLLSSKSIFFASYWVGMHQPFSELKVKPMQMKINIYEGDTLIDSKTYDSREDSLVQEYKYQTLIN